PAGSNGRGFKDLAWNLQQFSDFGRKLFRFAKLPFPLVNEGQL
ncbi:hypothetical protein LEMLEM_LOCUS6954, partial [Lemmus lemmus]